MGLHCAQGDFLGVRLHIRQIGIVLQDPRRLGHERLLRKPFSLFISCHQELHISIVPLGVHHRSTSIAQVHLLAIGNQLERRSHGDGHTVAMDAILPEDKLVLYTMPAAGRQRDRAHQRQGKQTFLPKFHMISPFINRAGGRGI